MATIGEGRDGGTATLAERCRKCGNPFVGTHTCKSEDIAERLTQSVHFAAHGDACPDPCSVKDNMRWYIDTALHSHQWELQPMGFTCTACGALYVTGWGPPPGTPVMSRSVLRRLAVQQPDKCLCEHGWRHCPVHQDATASMPRVW